MSFFIGILLGGALIAAGVILGVRLSNLRITQMEADRDRAIRQEELARQREYKALDRLMLMRRSGHVAPPADEEWGVYNTFDADLELAERRRQEILTKPGPR